MMKPGERWGRGERGRKAEVSETMMLKMLTDIRKNIKIPSHVGFKI